jgi:hypothetical protein
MENYEVKENKDVAYLCVTMEDYDILTIKTRYQVLGKTPLSKKAHEKTHIHRAKFNGRPKLPGWRGKDGAARSLSEQWLL